MIAALLAEGSSDRALLPILSWVLAKVSPLQVDLQWISGDVMGPARTLADKVMRAQVIGSFPLLFIHRDADAVDPEQRHEEIAQAAGDRSFVAVVPIRMMETWLLADEPAIRVAAGRPSGNEPLGLPRTSQLETVSDPKSMLREALRLAHGATGRRAKKFNHGAAVHRVAALVDDWTPLRKLSAFRRCESDTRAALGALGCALHPATS